VCAELVHAILFSLSLGLEVPEPGLSPTHSENLFQLCLLHYPAIAASELHQNRRKKINAHSDLAHLLSSFKTLSVDWKSKIRNNRGDFALRCQCRIRCWLMWGIC
jgi:hypothetical protein